MEFLIKHTRHTRIDLLIKRLDFMVYLIANNLVLTVLVLVALIFVWASLP